ncbi:hypothetical protein ACFJGW_12505 [Burkholderiaceae bacterium UC74_6]
MLRRRDLLGGLALAPAASAVRASTPSAIALRVFPGGSAVDFRWDVLRLTLAAAPEPWRSMRIEEAGAETVTQGRTELLLQDGQADIGAFGITAQRMAHLRPIRVDLLKGLIGLRVLVVRREDVDRFSRMTDEEILHKVRYGTHQQWADVPIMQGNGMHLELVSSASKLYQMLATGRFEALSRGANEVFAEMRANAELTPQLAIEPTHTLYYDYPIWFWVRRGNEPLAQALEAGLRNILRDGSFRELFLEKHKAEIDFVRKSRRHVIRLSSAALPQPVEPPDTSWWWPSTLSLNTVGKRI